MVSDLAYLRVGNKWNYTCIIMDLYNREIIGWSCVSHKNALLVGAAFARLPGNLNDYKIFHSDRGSEFDNMLIDEILKAFNIRRSLSGKGNLYDISVVEATFKIIKKLSIHNNSLL
ncbi:DDE-type integrase/transposase/recombinase [Erysipelothrix aquatica]|uniref:DDE-type integrase/transposase/recombinase n=1 Tax=Erysipelothrix aquatica TaxID=2683714 RepID=UPI0038B3590D